MDPSSPIPTNVGARPDRFVGRREALAQVRKEFSAGRRLVTLVGPPGAGKTRLAEKLAERCLRDPEGAWSEVWLVELQHAARAHDIVQSVATVLGINLRPGEPAGQRIGNALAERGRILLVLDNLEQVVADARGLADDWIRRASQVHILATSRARLRATGEQLVEIGPLAIAPPEADVAEAARCEAVALFEARAQAVRAGFELDGLTTPLVAEITRRLDGLPLAIELAAARLNIMSLEALRDRLDRRFDVLGSNDPSKGTLYGAIDWSWNLLSAAERSALAQCTVFQGDFEVEAAERVVRVEAEAPTGRTSFPPEGAPGGRAREAARRLELIQSLRDKSLLRIEPASGRLGMYLSIRDFATERATPSVLAGAIARHASHFGALARDLEEGLDGPQGYDALARVGTERDDLRAVVERAETRPELTDDALHCAHLLDRFYVLQGPHERAVRVLDVAAALSTRPDVSPRWRIWTRMARSSVARRNARPEDARAHLDAAEALLERHSDDRLTCLMLNQRAALALSSGDVSPSLAEVRRALAIAERLDDPGLCAKAHLTAGMALSFSGDVERAVGQLERALELTLQSEAVLESDHLRANLAGAYMRRADVESALALVGDGLPGMQVPTTRRIRGFLNLIAAKALQETRQTDQAAAAAEQAIDDLTGLGESEALAIIQAYHAELALDRNDADRADETLTALRHRLEGLPRRVCVLYHQINARRAWDGHDLVGAARGIEAALEAARRSQPHLVGVLLAQRAALAADLEDGGALEAARAELAELSPWDETGRFALVERLQLAHVDAQVLRQADSEAENSGTREAARDRLRRCLTEALARQGPRGEVRPWVERSAMAERAVHWLLAALPVGERDRLVAEAADPNGEALVVGPAGSWFRTPDGSEVDLSTKHLLARLLDLLAGAATRSSRESVPVSELIERLWSGERILPDAANNRLYYTVSTLRKLGLGDWLQRDAEGYRLDPATRVVRLGETVELG